MSPFSGATTNTIDSADVDLGGPRPIAVILPDVLARLGINGHTAEAPRTHSPAPQIDLAADCPTVPWLPASVG